MCNEMLSDKMKSAILTSAMPATAQDYIHSQANLESTHSGILEMGRLRIAKKVAADSGLSPMDVGGVKAGGSSVKSGGSSDWSGGWSGYQGCWGDECSHDRGHEQRENNDDGGEEGARAVAGVNDSDRNCGGIGDFARDCPSKGKGGGGNGKGFG